MFVQKMKQNQVWLITGGGLLALLLLVGCVYFIRSRRNGGGGDGDNKEMAGVVRNLKLVRTRADGDNDPSRPRQFGFAWDPPETGSYPDYYDIKYHYTLTLPNGEKVTEVTKSKYALFPGTPPAPGAYEMIIYASNQIGDGPRSEIKHVLALAPPAVKKITWNNADHAIEWTPSGSGDDRDAKTTYEVQIDGRSMIETELTRYIPSLMPSGSYVITVRAFNKYGSAQPTSETVVVRIFSIDRIDAKWTPVAGELDTHKLTAYVEMTNKSDTDSVAISFHQRDGKPLKLTPGGSCPVKYETTAGSCTRSEETGVDRCLIEGQLTFGPPSSAEGKPDCSMIQFDSTSLPGGSIQVTATGKTANSYQTPIYMQNITLPGSLPTAVRALSLAHD